MATTPKPKEPTPTEELPVVESLGMAKIPGKGYSLVYMRTQGDRFLERRIIQEPEPRAIALERYQLEMVRTFWLPKKTQ